MTDPTLQHHLIIRFINHRGFIGRSINWVTNSLWCHTEALSPDSPEWIGAHAGTGVQARPLDWCKPSLERRYAVPVTPSGFVAANAWLRSKIARLP